MKKLFLLFALSLCVAMPLFADDAQDVKNVIIQSAKDACDGKIPQLVSHFTEDYQETSATGMKITLAQLKSMLEMIDGAHPYEFYAYTALMLNAGKELTPEQKQELEAKAKSPEGLKAYQDICKAASVRMQASYRYTMETMKFQDVKVDGDKAVAVYTHNVQNRVNPDIIMSVTTTVQLKKVNGAWKLSSSQSVKK